MLSLSQHIPPEAGRGLCSGDGGPAQLSWCRRWEAAVPDCFGCLNTWYSMSDSQASWVVMEIQQMSRRALEGAFSWDEDESIPLTQAQGLW